MLYSTELRCGKRAAGVVRAARGEKNGRSPRSETKCGYEVGRGDGGPLRDPLMRHPSRFAPRSHLHRRHHPGRKDYAFRHLINTGMRCTKRTEAKIGLMLASVCPLSCAFATLMPRARLRQASDACHAYEDRYDRPAASQIDHQGLHVRPVRHGGGHADRPGRGRHTLPEGRATPTASSPGGAARISRIRRSTPCSAKSIRSIARSASAPSPS